MKTVAAIHTAYGQRLLVDELEVPDPRPDQVIVNFFSSGICHSQLHEINNPDVAHPWVLGHEGTGVLTHVGKGATHIQEGDHAIVTWVLRTPPSGRTAPAPSGVIYPERDFPMFLRWHQEGKFPLDKLVARRYELEQINEACDTLEAGDILGRAIIEY